jgi:ankyrin repeat protein
MSRHPPLFNAVVNGDIFEVSRLLDAGANINERTEWGGHGSCALHIAIEYSRHAIADILLRRGADHSNSRCFRSQQPIHNAASRNDAKMVDLLLQYRADVNCRDMLLQTPLHVATYWNFPDVVSVLLRNGADLNARTCFDANDMSPTCQGLTSLEMVKLMDRRESLINRDNVRGLLEAEQARRDIAFVMGQHARLGGNSPAYALDPEIARMVMKFLRA